MGLEELEKKLYQKTSGKEKAPPSQVFIKTETDKDFVKATWPEETPKPEKKISNFLAKFSRISRRLFWILIIVVLVLMGIAGFYFYQYSTSRDIVFSLNASSTAMLGVPFNIEMSIQNNYTNPMKDVKLSMILPEGAAFVAESAEKRNLDWDFGDLDKNSSFQKEIPVTSSHIRRLE